MPLNEYQDIMKEDIAKIVPNFSEKDIRDIRAYFTIYEKYADSFAEQALNDLKDHPVFGKLIATMPKEEMEANSKLSRKMQGEAIFNNEWEPYIEYQVQQGIAYAKMGFDIKAWYDVVTIAKNYIRPLIYEDYKGDADGLLSALNGMDLFMDAAMCTIGEAYIREKQEIILEGKEKIRKMNEELEQRIADRTAELESINKELNAFTYSVSHDLRAPLRAVNGYAEMLNEDYGTKLDDEGKRIIQTIRYNATKMGTLIDNLLDFSRLGRKEMVKTSIDMNELTEGVLMEINKSVEHHAEIKIGKLLPVKADYGLLHQIMFNLVSNAIKYSSKKEKPVVEISSKAKNDEIIFTVKDNGAGFDMRYADKLFGVFQRLHTQEEFEGTGVGLAIVQRVVAKHNGRVWAEGKVNEGATFNFSLATY